MNIDNYVDTNTIITIIVVIYNKQLDDSSICLKLAPFAKIVVVDNSDNVNDNKLFCDKNGLLYISMGGNKGLSKAYNSALELIGNTDLIMLLDDDTDVPVEYLDKLKNAERFFQDVDVFVPIVVGQDDVIYSPNNYYFLKNRLVKDPIHCVSQEKFNAISSCMAIRKHVFDDYRFNEELFVDEIDHCFCHDQRKIGRKFFIIDFKIHQTFHQREKKINPLTAWNRVKIRITDIFRYAHILGKKYWILAFIKCSGIGIQMGIKSKSFILIIKAFCQSFLIFLGIIKIDCLGKRYK